MSAGAALELHPARTAVLAMDWQSGILAGMSIDAPIEATRRILEQARAVGATVAFVRVAFAEAEFAGVPPWSRFAEIARTAKERFTEGSPETAVDERLAPREGEIVVRKTRIGAFSTTDLDAQLRARGVDTLILTGVATSGVVLSTVRDGSDRDYRLIVAADACADRDAEVHDALMRLVFPRQATVASAADVCRVLEASRRDD